MPRLHKRFVFACPTCGKVSVQNNTVVRADTQVLCLNVSEHKNKQTRIMKVENASRRTAGAVS